MNTNQPITLPPLRPVKALTSTVTFRVDETGVYADEGNEEMFVSGPVELLSELRDEHSKGWKKLLKFKNRDGEDMELLVGNAFVYKRPRGILSTFLDAGVQLGATRRAEILFIQYLKQLSTGVPGGADRNESFAMKTSKG
jgi:hypothetical protein